MARFQLEIAITLAVSALVSLSDFYFTRIPEGKVQLPISLEADELGGWDPFDIITPQDIVDGFPVDGDAFWARVRYRSVIVSRPSIDKAVDAFEEDNNIAIAMCYCGSRGDQSGVDSYR